MGLELKRLSVRLTRVPEYRGFERWKCPRIKIEKIIKINLEQLTVEEIKIHAKLSPKVGSEENPIVIEDDSLDE